MKYATAALCLVSATLSLAAPTTKVAARDASTAEGFALPSVVKVHDLTSNQNTWSSQTSTVRNGGFETSTLYDIPIPASLQGRTCGLVFRSAASGDNVSGEQALDIFKNNFQDLASLTEGNLRDSQLARIRFDAASGLYQFDETAFVPTIKEFPCPAGNTLHWEAAAVGEFDINVVHQDTVFDGQNVPNGISVAWW